MARSKSKNGEQDVEAKAALHKAMAQPLRHRVLIILREREASPKEISDELGEPLGNVAYHVRQLAKAGLIELVDTDKRHGGTQHFYRATVEPILDTPEAEALTQLEREAGSEAIIPRVIDDIVASIEAGKFDSHPARSLLRMLLVLDEEGMRQSGVESMRHLARLSEIEAESTERLAKSGEQGMNVATATLVFPMGDRPQERKAALKGAHRSV